MVELNDILNEAMNSELEAKKFYLEAVDKAQSQAGKKLFQELAEFEQNHYEKVKMITESLNQKLAIEPPKPTHDNLTVESEIEGEIEPNKDEIVTILGLAIESEKKAQERYLKISEMFNDEKNKKIFFDLSQEERNHQSILEHEVYQLSNKGTIIWE